MSDPHHRLIAAQRAIKSGQEATDPKVRELIAALTNEDSAKPAVKYALRKFLIPYQRAVLDALFLGGATPDEIFQATEMPKDAIQAYGDYIFDNSVFDDRLDRVTWVESQQDYCTPAQLQILMAAMSVGPKYLVWMLTGRGNYSPAEVLRILMNDSTQRSLAHRLAPLDSNVAKEAHVWARTAERLAKTVSQVDPQDEEEARKQLYIALSHRDDTGNAETTGIPPEKILH
jgi:hypothetical protein